MDLQTQARITEEFVQGLLDKMGLEARVASTIEEDRLTVEAQGLNLGLAIGQQGDELVWQVLVGPGPLEAHHVLEGNLLGLGHTGGPL